MTLVHINSAKEFTDLVSNNKVAVMICRSGCPYCEKAKPWVEELSEELSDRIMVLISREKTPKLIEFLNIKTFPTFILIDNGVISDEFYGNTKEEKVKSFLSQEMNTSLDDIESQMSLDDMEEW